MRAGSLYSFSASANPLFLRDHKRALDLMPRDHHVASWRSTQFVVLINRRLHPELAGLRGDALVGSAEDFLCLNRRPPDSLGLGRLPFSTIVDLA
jgi:hypothetical protein